MSINAIGSVVPRDLPFAHGVTTSSPAPSLLPTPKSDSASDPLAQLYALLTTQENQQNKSDLTSVTQHKAERTAEIAAEGKAFDEEQKAKDGGHGLLGSFEKLVGDLVNNAAHLRVSDMATDAKADVFKGMIENPHFFDDLAKVAKTVGEVYAIIGGAVLTVGTGGSAGAVVAIGIALSVSAMADQQFHILHALGVSDKAANFIDLGMAVVGSVLTMGPGVSASAAGAASTATTSAASSTSASLSQFGRAATAASSGAQAISAGATGANQIEQGAADANALDAQADELSAQQATAKTDRLLAWLMTQIQAGQKSFDSTKRTVQSAIETQNSTSLALASFGKA